MIALVLDGRESVVEFWRAARKAVETADRPVPVYHWGDLLFYVSGPVVPLVTAEVMNAMSLAEYDRRFPNPTGCTICRNPNCDAPNGKH